MTKPGKSPKKKTKEKSPQRTEESEYPAMDEETYNRLTELYQTVHLKEFTDVPKKDEKDPTMVFTDIHFEKKSIAHEAYHLSHGLCQ